MLLKICSFHTTESFSFHDIMILLLCFSLQWASFIIVIYLMALCYWDRNPVYYHACLILRLKGFTVVSADYFHIIRKPGVHLSCIGIPILNIVISYGSMIYYSWLTQVIIVWCQ